MPGLEVRAGGEQAVGARGRGGREAPQARRRLAGARPDSATIRGDDQCRARVGRSCRVGEPGAAGGDGRARTCASSASAARGSPPSAPRCERGARVVGLDAGPVGGGAAGRNGGFLLAGCARFHHDAVAPGARERAVALYRATLDEIDRLAAELGPVVRRVGSLRTPASAAEAEDCARAARRAACATASRPSGPATASCIPGDGAIQPLARCRLLAAARAGRRRAPALRLAGRSRSRATASRTAAGEVRCGAVVVCVDGGLERLLPELAGTRALDAPADAGHRARRAGHRALPALRQLGLRLLAAAARRPDRARRRPRPPRRRVGAGADDERRRAGPARRDPARPRRRARRPSRTAGRARWPTRRTGCRCSREVRPGVARQRRVLGHGNVLGSAAGRAAAALALGEPPPALARLLRPEYWN